MTPLPPFMTTPLGESSRPEAVDVGDMLRTFAATVRRRKTVFLAVLFAVPLAALIFSLAQTPMYESSATVLITRQDIAGSVTDTQDQNLASEEPDRFLQTESALAQSPAVARRVLD